MKRGQQKRIPTPGVQQRQHIIGAYDWANDAVAWTTAERKNSAHFVSFLEHLLLECYPTERVVLVMDNASFHKSKTALAALSLFERRVIVIWLPPYCSTLNPIERFWRHLKDAVCINTLYPSLPDLSAAVERQLDRQNCLHDLSRFSFSKI